MKAEIKITLKTGVLDPQGKAIERALQALGYDGIADVRQGKFVEIELVGRDESEARTKIDKMCQDLLANQVIENYSFELVP
ncbi:MAG: phosphoribosylformylglycinamidine synthase subunit PurS [Hyphomicrobiaceae bacterium]